MYTIVLVKSATIYGLLDATLALGGVLAGVFGTWWWKKSKE
ncbi:hypothetical protein ACFFH4_17135 [Halalkalibacter alkalisediminis]|uniref:Uncharacterized protein n=1 Tax=Halalkalibacter alkalisediminis TaxID=935616 RepID=A0ABV6NJ67_9BACI|nr:hypothetical protein [Halalkalibacter alkalisediminis]